MYFRQLKYLVAIIEEGHFGRAAAKCNATQPSLSNGIKQLELELGVPIFLRGRGQRLQGLAAEGERIARWARLIIAHCEAMKDEIDDMQDDLHGNLRIGAMSTISPVLPYILQLVRARYPNVRVDVRFSGHDAIRACLDNFSLDVAMAYMDTDSIGRRNMLPIYTEKLSLLVPDVEQFGGRSSISWKEAASLPLGLLRPSAHERQFVDGVFLSTVGETPVPKVESESILHLMFQFQYTELCTIIPSHFTRMPGLHPGTKALELVEPTYSREVGLFWAEAETMMPMASVMVGIVKKLNNTNELRTLLEASHEGAIDPARFR